MKVTCDREKLLAGFQLAALIAPSRSPKAILQKIKLDTSGERAMLMATDMDVGIRLEPEGIDVNAAGAALLPVSRFNSILRESSDEKLHIEADSQGSVIRGEHSEFKLPAENPDEFPQVATFQEEKFHVVPAKLFRELVRRTLFATDVESSRYALGGVFLEFGEDKITAVGTDGRRLAKMEGPVQAVGNPNLGENTTIVPTRSMQLLERVISDDDTEIQVAVHPNDILVKTPRAVIYSRLVEGRFPKWRDVFPQRRDAVKIELVVGPVFSALRQASVVASDESRGIDFVFGAGSLVMTGSSSDFGSARVELPIAYDGPSRGVTLDHRYVADFLRVLDVDKQFTVEVEDEGSPALFTTDDGYGYVVMPLARRKAGGGATLNGER